MLEQFGLSKYEDRVYLTLLKIGESEAREISKISEVPFGRIYDTLNQLLAKKLVDTDDGRPKMYWAVHPNLAMTILMDSKEQELQELKKQSEVANQELNKIYTGKTSNELIWKLAIGKELYPTYFDLLAESHEEFLSYTEITQGILADEDHFLRYLPFFNELRQKKVEIKLIFGVADNSLLKYIINLSEILSDFVEISAIRATPTRYTGFNVIDGEKVLMEVTDPMYQENLLAGIYLWDNNLATTMRESFLKIWEDATPMDELMAEFNV